MANEYILIKQKSDSGMIALNKSVFKSIVEISIDDNDDVFRLLETRFYKPITIKIVGNKLNISVGIGVKFGSNIDSVSKQLQSKIYDSILQMTNIKTHNISIIITNILI